MDRKIGVLAGMGPRSTAPFIDMVIAECALQYHAKYDADFPAMIIYSLPTPFYPDRPVNHAALRDAILAGLKELAGFGVDFIAMPCNIAHLYYRELANATEVPLLNIIDETILSIPPSCMNVALFAARGTAESGLYQQGLFKAGKTPVCRPEWQIALDRLIMSAKENGCDAANRATMTGLLSDARRFADCVIIGCTDLSPILPADEIIPIRDSARCLAAAVTARYVILKA